MVPVPDLVHAPQGPVARRFEPHGEHAAGLPDARKDGRVQDITPGLEMDFHAQGPKEGKQVKRLEQGVAHQQGPGAGGPGEAGQVLANQFFGDGFAHGTDKLLHAETAVIRTAPAEGIGKDVVGPGISQQVEIDEGLSAHVEPLSPGGQAQAAVLPPRQVRDFPVHGVQARQKAFDHPKNRDFALAHDNGVHGRGPRKDFLVIDGGKVSAQEHKDIRIGRLHPFAQIEHVQGLGDGGARDAHGPWPDLQQIFDKPSVHPFLPPRPEGQAVIHGQ